MKKIYLILAMCMATSALAQNEIIWKKNFGGAVHNFYYSVTTVPDGVVAVGYFDRFNSSSGSDDWEGMDFTERGRYIATIVKYDNNGNVIWKKIFGGRSGDFFYSVTAVSDGIVAAGYSGGGDGDATIVKFDNDGNVVWKKNFGRSGQWHRYNSVTAVSDGIVAAGSTIAKYDNDGNVIWRKYSDYSSVTAVLDGVVAAGESTITKYDNDGNEIWSKNSGYSSVTTVFDGIVAVGTSGATSFTNGDWTGYTGKGGDDAIMVKYDNAGNIVYQKNFGGSNQDVYESVTATSDDIVAVGYSYPTSFNTGDWTGVTGKGSYDAIIVKYDNASNIVWKKNFGGSDEDYYNSVTAVSDGIVAIGYSKANSFNTGDWTGNTGKGSTDAIIVKYDNAGNIAYQKNFGGSDEDYYNSVTAVSDGIVAVGYSKANSFNTGDWMGYTGKGYSDATIVKYDNSGNSVWKKNFGGSDTDYNDCVTATSDGIVTVGGSFEGSFNTGDFTGVIGKGGIDATLVKYFIPVTDIAGVPATATVGTPLTLTGTVTPSEASYKTIIWTVASAGTTGAVITGNQLFVTAAGTAVITATVINGTSMGNNFTKSFYINATTTGVETITADALSIYPNPVKDELLIINNEQLTMNNVEIVDIMGKIIYNSSFIINNSINVSSLPQGIYFLKIETDKGIVTKKFVKE